MTTEERNMDETGPRTPQRPLSDAEAAIFDEWFGLASDGFSTAVRRAIRDGLLHANYDRLLRIEAAARAWLAADQAYIEADFGADEEEQAVAHVAKDELRASLRQGDSE